MFDSNGKPLPLLRISKRSSCRSYASVMLTTLLELPPPARIALLLMLAVLVGSLSGCATPSAPPSLPAINPAPAQISEPLPQKSYSSRVESFLRKSRELLTGTPPM